MPTHACWLTYMHTCVCPFHLCPNCTGPNLPTVLGPGLSPPRPSPPQCLLLICPLPSLPLPHSFLLTNKPPLAYPCIPPLPHTDTLASAPTFPGLKDTCIPMHAHLLAHTLTDEHCTHSAPTWITKLVYIHPNNLSACLRTSTGPSPPRKEATPHSSQHRMLRADTPTLGRSDAPLTLTGLSPPHCSSLSSPAPPSSQNSLCHCSHCHLRCCHC